MTSTNFNSLNLTFKETILDGILLKEKIDIDLLDKLINSNLLKETFNNPMSKIYKTEKHQLQKYRELITDGYANVKYERVKDTVVDLTPINRWVYFLLGERLGKH